MQLLTKRYIVFRGITIGCLQLSTISCRHKKSGNPVKSRLPLQIKEARDGARGPGDLGLRRPERSVDIELSSPGRAQKKERYRFGIVLFFMRARDGDRTRKAFLAEMPEIREMLINIGFAETSEIRYVR